MDFTAFDTSKLDDYAARAKAAWGNTAAYREYAEKNRGREENLQAAGVLMGIFRELGALREKSPESAEAQALVDRLRTAITENFYTCTPEILSGLGQMYAAGGDMTENIDRAGGPGTAVFAEKAISYYVENL